MLGHYLPARNPKVLELDKDAVLAWIAKGAQPSETVAALLKNEGFKDMDKFMSAPNKKRKRKKATPEDEAPAAAPTPAAQSTEPATTTEEAPSAEPEAQSEDKAE